MPADPTGCHIAQVNVGRLVAPVTAAEVAEFMALLDPINALADASPGFVWRLQSDSGNATDIRPFDDDELLINMSVWRSLEELRDFTYRSAHVDVLRRRREWFHKLAEAHLALWWVPVGHIPTPSEAETRLRLLREHGPTPEAFMFRTPFGPPTSSGRRAPTIDAEFCLPFEVSPTAR